MSLIFAMCVYSFSMSVSPGPVNLITLSTGVSHGFRKALPFVTGASMGFALLLYLIGLGIYQLAEAYPGVMLVMTVAGSLFIAYMGYNILTSKPQVDVKKQHIPKFYQGVILQWLNPKAWIASVAGVSAFNLSESHHWLLVFVSLYFVICFFCIAAWALLGTQLTSLLKTQHHVKLFNYAMGSSLILIAVYLLLRQHG